MSLSPWRQSPSFGQKRKCSPVRAASHPETPSAREGLRSERRWTPEEDSEPGAGRPGGGLGMGVHGQEGWAGASQEQPR